MSGREKEWQVAGGRLEGNLRDCDVANAVIGAEYLLTMRYNKLGRTDLEVSEVSFGTAPLGDMFGSADEDQAIASVHHALDAGINFFDSSPYYGGGLAEERLGAALAGRREDVLIGTKAGRYGNEDFDFSPRKLRESIHTSLKLLRTDYVDVLQLHDIEFVPLSPVFEDSYAELVKLKDEGLCRYIGMTGYPMHTLTRAVTETDLDVILSYAHFTLLNTELATALKPVCDERGVGVINAAAVGLGLLTPGGVKPHIPATDDVKAAAARARQWAADNGQDISFLANQFSLQRSGCPTTVIGTTKVHHLHSAIRAATEPIDTDVLDAVLALTADVHDVSWQSGLPENNG